MLKKFDEKLKAQILEAFESRKLFIGEMKAADEDHTFEVIASTEGQDRDGEVVMQDGIDLTNYLKNPVILFGHDYWSLPIGKATEVFRKDGQTIVRGIFATKEANPVAEQCRLLYQQGILKAVSIGFIPKRYEGNRIVECELLELSFVPVPANPEALSMLNYAKSLGIEKELAFAVKSAIAQGVKMDEETEKIAEEAENGSNEGEGAPAAEPTLEEKIAAIVDQKLKPLSEAVDTINSQVKEMGEILAKSKTVDETGEGSDTGKPEGEAKSGEMKEALMSVLEKAQRVAALTSSINCELKKLK